MMNANGAWTETQCDTCGKAFQKYIAQLRPHNFCSRECFKKFASERMSHMNRELNPTRMTPATREKLRAARLGSGEGKSYKKTYGRHTHRVVAEQKIGRPLRPGEIVHHKDGNKRNNAAENLEVLDSQSTHVQQHRRENPHWGRKGSDYK